METALQLSTKILKAAKETEGPNPPMRSSRWSIRKHLQACGFGEKGGI
jgi:hypothetical protein